VGIVPLAKALELAQEYDLDLVEVAASAKEKQVNIPAPLLAR